MLDQPGHAGLQRLVRDLNGLYAAEPALHASDADPAGFQWLVGDDTANSVFVFLRRAGEAPPLLCAVNCTPVPRYGYRIGVPLEGRWREVLNTDAEIYGGGNIGSGGEVEAAHEGMHGQPASLELVLPPLAMVVLKPDLT